jgi:tetratricopeptide (TPR) repeat protein
MRGLTEPRGSVFLKMKSYIASVNSAAGRRGLLAVLLWLTLAFSLATWIGPQVEARLMANGAGNDDPAARWLGDSRRMFAQSFFVKADAYYHSGYYPTIYDNNAPFQTPHIGEDSSTMESHNSGDETTIFSHPHNWVERFELNFFPSYHTHLDQGGVDGSGASEVKEILPWLKISAELDQHRIETYLVTAYWLRVRMGKVNEAEDFLRDGLRANPGSAAIIFELGQVYFEGRHDPDHARNLYLLALDNWGKENSGKTEQDKFLLSHIASALYKLEKQEDHIPQAIEYLKLLKRVSPVPDDVQKLIDELDPISTLIPNTMTQISDSLNQTKYRKP